MGIQVRMCSSSVVAAPDMYGEGHSPSTQLLDAYILKESRKPPTCTLKITASHISVRTYYDSDGHLQTERHTVTTYRGSKPFHYNCWSINENYCLSEEQRQIVNKNFKKRIYLTTTQLVKPADKFTTEKLEQAIKDTWYENRHRDINVEV